MKKFEMFAKLEDTVPNRFSSEVTMQIWKHWKGQTRGSIMTWSVFQMWFGTIGSRRVHSLS